MAIDSRRFIAASRVLFFAAAMAQAQEVPPPAPAAPAPAVAAPAGAAPQPLDLREPTFGEFDFGWMNGNNPQPSSLLVFGPITGSLYVDTYYAWQFARPIDHTIFPTTTAPRFNEISLNLAHLGIDVTGLDGPIGRLYIQYGSTVETIAGQDTTTTRGFFLTNRLLQNVEQAAAGWHFHSLHGINVEMGIFPSYVGLESYLPEENWSYTHAFMADFTPYYFFGLRGQLFLSQRFKLELWAVNGWQTFGEWHEARSGGYLWNWRPREWLSLVNSFYAGSEVEGDPQSLRLYTDNNLQIRYYKAPAESRFLKSLAFSLVADLGHEHRGNAPSGWMGGLALAHRFEWTDKWKSTVRVDFYDDQTEALTAKFPVGSVYPWPDKGPLRVGGESATIDFWPSPWLVTRLEYSHRESNLPYFSGHGGITGPGGVLPTSAAAQDSFVPDLVTHDDWLILNITLRLLTVRPGPRSTRATFPTANRQSFTGDAGGHPGRREGPHETDRSRLCAVHRPRRWRLWTSRRVGHRPGHQHLGSHGELHRLAGPGECGQHGLLHQQRRRARVRLELHGERRQPEYWCADFARWVWASAGSPTPGELSRPRAASTSTGRTTAPCPIPRGRETRGVQLPRRRLGR